MRRTLLSLAAGLALALPAAAADVPIPTADLAGGKDLSWLKRYEASFLVDYQSGAFDEMSFPLSELKATDRSSPMNNIVYRAEKNADVQGTLTRLTYVVPAGRSPLEVLSNYEEEFTAKGGQKLYACKEDECGGEVRYSPNSGGGKEGILNIVYPADTMKQPIDTAGYCVWNNWHNGLRYAVFKTPTDGSEATVAIVAFSVEASQDCKLFNDRTVVAVISVETKPREQKMETVTAEQMGGDIMAGGKAVLYGILFDTDKATIKPESKPQMDEIAAYLKANEGKEYLVVGHTDNQGELDYNVDLSKRRAAAVVAALTGDYGIAKSQLKPFGNGMTAPVASNESEEGRAKNRRVEIVAR